MSVHGLSSADEDNHDAAYLSGSEGDESDEDDLVADAPDAHESDESDEEAPHAGPSTIHQLVTLETHLDMSSRAGPSKLTSATPYIAGVSTTLGPRLPSKSVQFASQPMPSPKSPRADATAQDNATKRTAGKPGLLSELRPSLYRIASRSMIDFGTSNWSDRDRVGASSNTPSISAHTAETSDSHDADVTRRFRRNSIPNYHHPASDPPPYPSFNPRTTLAPPVDETRERLPAYSNSLYLMAVMPRKMEFIAPGVQAKDRKWRRVLCELEGTVFRVYKCPPGASGAGILGDWWERQVGVGDVSAVSNTAQSQVPAERSRGGPQEAKVRLLQRPETRERSVSQPSRRAEGTPSPSSRGARRTSGASFLTSFHRSSGNAARSGPDSRGPTIELLPVDLHSGHSRSSSESVSHSTGTSAHIGVAMPPPRSASRLSFLPSGRPHHHHRPPNPSKHDLIRAYTLQNAESGLGSDYVKRRNVIRVRLEGEQFLLQAPDVPSVVEWIEVGGRVRPVCADVLTACKGLHAGTNIALDLDQRTMPRGPMFPR